MSDKDEALRKFTCCGLDMGARTVSLVKEMIKVERVGCESVC